MVANTNSIRKSVTFSLSEERNAQQANIQSLPPTTSIVGKKTQDIRTSFPKDVSQQHILETRDPFIAKFKEKSKVKKTLVRNVEQPIKPIPNNRRRLKNVLHSVPENEMPRGKVKYINYTNKYSAPELYSTLLIAQEINHVDKTKSTKNDWKIRPGAQQILETKVSSKLNFPFEEHLYRDLVSLAVSDDELFGSDEERRRKCFESARWKDKEPQLSEFFTPVTSNEYSVSSWPVLSNVDRIRNYNGFSIYKKKHNWECLD